MKKRLRILSLVLMSWALALLAPGTARSQMIKSGHDTLSSLTFRSERLQAKEEIEPLEVMRSVVPSAAQAAWANFQLDAPVEWRATVDKRHGLVSFAEGGGIAWIPGKGNSLKGAHKVNLETLETIARNFLPRVAGMMGVDPKSLVLNVGRSGQPAGHLWFVDFDVVRDGMKIEGARVVFRVNNGNLIQFGTENLPVPGSVAPPVKVTRIKALEAAAKYIGGFGSADSFGDSGSLHLLPANLGAGRRLAKVWQFIFHRDGVMGTWQVRVDATNGEVLELADVNEYAQATGGIYQNSPTTGPEIVRPMPFTDVSTGGYTNSAGLYNFTGGTVTSTLSGLYVRSIDACGAIAQASDASGDIAFGTSAGTDCATPGHGGAGNTHASREQFYQVNRIKEVARGWLPSNTWLGQQLSVNVNLNLTCNAYWKPATGTLNFFKSGGGCRNSGEISGVSLHEFGHGLDQNDGTGTAPEGGTGEAYGDTTSFIALHDSCIGEGFLPATCGGYGDACTSCTGVRDVDWAKHASNTPATVSNFTQVRCGSGAGPCGREMHCESYVPSEAVWDFANRDLPGAGTGPAWTVLDRLWYLSRGTATSAFTCNTSGTFTSNGCGTGSWWKTMRAVDDDDGNLTNGTPHGAALFAAFNRHGIACTTDAGAGTSFNGCTQPAVPALTISPGDNSATLSWTASGSAVYDVFRNETGCNAGFTKVVSSGAATSFTDTNVANGLTYYYQVTAFPSGNEACASAPSTCQSVTVAPPPPDFTISCSPSTLSIQKGANDTSTCTVTSLNGFASSTALSCSGLPAGVTCAFVPSSVTPPSGGGAASTLTVAVAGSVAPGSYSFQAQATSGSLTRNTTLSLTVPAPDFTITCTPASLLVPQTGSAFSTCTVTSLFGFASTINFGCPGAPAGVTCSFTPSSATPPAGGSVTTTLTASAASTAVTGPYTLKVRGTSAAVSEKTNIALVVATPVFVDDFETDQGWTVNPKGTDTATGGIWARGIPAVSRYQIAAESGSFDLVTGPNLLTGGSGDDVDGGVTTVRSPAITLPASGTLTLSFAYYLGYNATATAEDFLRVRVIGTTTTTLLRVVAGTDPGTPSWQTLVADISAFAGQTVRITIDATDAATNDNIEAAIDDVQITQQ